MAGDYSFSILFNVLLSTLGTLISLYILLQSYRFITRVSAMQAPGNSIWFTIVLLCTSSIDAAINSLAISNMGIINPRVFSYTYFEFWMSSWTGIMLVSPVLISLHAADSKQWDARRFGRATLVCIVLVAYSLVVFVFANRYGYKHVIPIFLMPVVLAVALNSSSRTTLVAVFLMNMLFLCLAVVHFPYNIAYYQSISGVVMLTVLVIISTQRNKVAGRVGVCQDDLFESAGHGQTVQPSPSFACSVEEKLRQSEDKYRNIINSASDGIIIIKHGLIRFANMAMLEMIDDSFENVIGKDYTVFIEEGSLEKVRELDMKIKEGNTSPAVLQVNLRHSRGMSLTVEISTTRFTYDNEEAQLLFIRDISPRIKALDAISMNEKRFRAVFDKSPIAMSICLIDTGELVDVNDNYCRLTGYGYNELIRRSERQVGLLLDEYNPSLEKYCDLLKTNGTVIDYPVVLLASGGELRYVQRYSEVMSMGDKRYAICQSLDVTIQKSIEMQLDTYQQQLEQLVEERTHELAQSQLVLKKILTEQQTILDTAQVGISLVKQNNFAWVNMRMEALLGRGKEQLIGHHYCILFDNEDDFALFEAECKRNSTSNATTHIEVKMATVDGRTTWVSIIAKAIDASGSSFIILLEDITVRREEQRLLREAKEKAENANRVKTEFIANMSHEIRTPMNAIIGFAEILQVKTENSEELSQYTRGIISSGNSLMTLLNDILDLSKIDAGKLSIQDEMVDIRLVINELMQVFDQNIRQKKLLFTISISEKVPREVNIDQLRLRQILLNIIGNAVKYTEKGSIDICVEVGDFALGANKLIIEVTDSGVGIPDEYVQRIFEPFVQVEGGGRSSYAAGMGLGLAITKRLVDMMKGQIRVESIVGCGSKFIIEFFDVFKTVKSPLPESSTELFDLEFDDAVVMVVDDMDVHRMVIKGYLELNKLTVVTAENGQVALGKLADARPRLILMDMQMPVLDGLAATRLLRKSTSYCDIPVIALSVVDPSSLSDEDKELFDDYLIKPIKMTSLVKKLSKFLTYKRLVKPQSVSIIDQVMGWIDAHPHEMCRIEEFFSREIEPLCTNIEVSLDLDNVDKLSQTLKMVGEQLCLDGFISLSLRLKAYRKTIDIENTLLVVRELLAARVLVLSTIKK